MVLRGADVSSVTTHLEPSGSDGPAEEDVWQVVADTETVSFQLNRFRSDMGWTVGKWPSPKTRHSPQDIPGWLVHDIMAAHSTFSLAENDLAILGTVWAHRGSQHSRGRLLKLLGVRRHLREAIQRMLGQGIVSVMYHPTLDLCGLPEGVLLAIRDSPKREVRRVKEWLLGAMPYARVLSGGSGRTLVVHGRLPLYRGGIFAEMLDQTLEEEFNVDYKLGRVDSSSTYITTVLNRLYSSETES